MNVPVFVFTAKQGRRDMVSLTLGGCSLLIAGVSQGFRKIRLLNPACGAGGIGGSGRDLSGERADDFPKWHRAARRREKLQNFLGIG